MSATAIELPLFPLNTVLFPGTVAPLHIFEPRYRQMVVDCQRDDKPFGLVLVKPDSTFLHEEPYPVGTIAEIRNLERLEDGRYTFMAVGVKRFRIESQHREKPYLSGFVVPIDDDEEQETELTAAMNQADELFKNYLKMLLEAANETDIQTNLPDTPEDLSYFIAYFLDIQEEQKQHFLELTSTVQRLQEEISILKREVPFMRQILSKKVSDDRTMLN